VEREFFFGRAMGIVKRLRKEKKTEPHTQTYFEVPKVPKDQEYPGNPDINWDEAWNSTQDFRGSKEVPKRKEQGISVWMNSPKTSLPH
jgi:hypothetical protein